MHRNFVDSKIKQKAFTLAEVLIVIAVLAVIAAVTIPNLFYSYDEKQLNTRWKKEFNVAVNAVKKIYSKQGYIDFSSDSNMRSDFGSVMHFMSEGTWGSLSGQTYNYYKNSTNADTSTWSTLPAALMMDSSIWLFDAYPGCTGSLGTLDELCARIIIDVNAANEPNEYGKDLYFIHIVNNGGDYLVYPFGGHGDGQTCATTGTEDASRGCSARALIDTADDMP